MSLKGKAIRWFMKSAPFGLNRITANKLIGEYGKMIEFKFDPKSKYIFTSVLLAGEIDPIEIEIRNYELMQTEDKTMIVVKEARAGREWVNVLINQVLVGKKIPVPSDKVELIRDLLGR